MMPTMRSGAEFICGHGEWTLDNYKYIFGESDIYHATFISALRTVIGTVVSVFCTAMLAYTVSRQEFVLRNL